MPPDARLIRDETEEQIADDVDTLEETNYLSLALLGLELILAIATLTAVCVKKIVRRPRSTARLARLRHQRDPVFNADFEAVRI